MTDMCLRATLHRNVKGPKSRPPTYHCSFHECVPCRLCAHAVAIESSAAKLVSEILTLPPDALTLEPGELSPVVRHPSESPHDIFRCSGCTDAACQVWTCDHAIVGDATKFKAEAHIELYCISQQSMQRTNSNFYRSWTMHDAVGCCQEVKRLLFFMPSKSRYAQLSRCNPHHNLDFHCSPFTS
jgi:hypothetical protein